MMLKGNKEKITYEVYSRVYAKVSNNLSHLTYGGQVHLNDLIYAIQNAVVQGVQEGIETLIDNQYTHEDFENDMQLK